MRGAMGIPENFCALCAQHQKTCCQTREVYITPGDVRRIEAHTGRTGFWEFRIPADPEYLDQSDDPAWAGFVFRPDGSRRILRHQPDGACMFLGPAGCLLPLEIRPLVCRLYPYQYNEQGLLAELAGGCPTHLLRPGQDLLTVLHVTPEDARRWHSQLYREIRLEKAPACASV